jgi:uncharacterized protein YihD (DUF1040 family)
MFTKHGLHMNNLGTEKVMKQITNSVLEILQNKTQQGPLLLLLYINDFPQITNSNSKIVPFADDISIIVTNPNHSDLKNDINKLFNDINEWFKANLLSINIDKTYFMHFSTKNSYLTDLNITYNNKKYLKSLI